MKQKIILASVSQIRKKLLLQAEVNFQSIAAKIDEDTIKESLKNEGAKPKDISDALAEYKAIRVANNFPTDLIIGCDQLLVCDNELIGILYSNIRNRYPIISGMLFIGKQWCKFI